MATRKTSNSALKQTLDDMISDENTGISRVRAEVDIHSNEFIETLAAISCSMRCEQLLAE